MHLSQGRPDRRIRSIFISDTHLGCKYSQAETLLAFLNSHQPEFLYLVGDIVDGWRLKRAWHWQPAYSQILHRLLDMSRAGTLVRYTPGNHDAFLRPFVENFGHVLGFIEIREEFIHAAADGRRYLVLHGDQFDNIEIRAQWLSVIGAHAYNTLMWANSLINCVRGWVGLPHFSYSAALKMSVKQAVTFVSNFQKRLCEHAHQRRCQGVVCGHVHMPAIDTHDGTTYCNSGDWVEHCTALVEYDDGEMAIVQVPMDKSLTEKHAPVYTQLTQSPQDSVEMPVAEAAS